MAVDREKGDPSADREDDQECDRAGNEMRRWELVDENRLQWACCIGQSLQSITRTWPSDDEGGNAGGEGGASNQSVGLFSLSPVPPWSCWSQALPGIRCTDSCARELPALTAAAHFWQVPDASSILFFFPFDLSASCRLHTLHIPHPPPAPRA